MAGGSSSRTLFFEYYRSSTVLTLKNGSLVNSITDGKARVGRIK